MAELGYKRSAKKCKEKFENVHKYYKRTKEGRAGRQDGKTYKFFSELEALQAVSSPPPPPPQPVLSPLPVSISLQPPPVSLGTQFGNPVIPVPSTGIQLPSPSHVFPGAVVTALPDSSPVGLIFSSNSSSLSLGSSDDDDDVEGEPSTAGSSRKRKRVVDMPAASDGRGMREYFEGLMKRVMQKQEEMHKRFLEAIEKREQDRLVREEAWRRQEMYRLAREQELMAQERAVSASRDAAIMSFLQKITGQTFELPIMATVNTVPVVSPMAPLAPQQPAGTSPPSRTQPQHQPQRQPLQPTQTYQPTLPVSREVMATILEQQVPPVPQEIIGTSGGGVGGSRDVPSSSRWPKAEVLALIRLRSGMESKYLEAGPKGPLWDEISAGMLRLGYKRNPKRCKEKWENINKYFKKVKESNKKRPEDAKTCPYFHELDALYRRKVLTGQSSGFEIRSDPPTNIVVAEAQMADLERPKKNGVSDNEETESVQKPEDTVKEMNFRSEQQQARVVDFGSDKADDVTDHDNLDQDENKEELYEEEDGDEEEGKMAYKIEYQQQRHTAGTPNSGRSGSAPSFATMVQ